MPACSGAPGVMGIHNTHTYIYTHPATHTQSAGTRAHVQMAPPCVDSDGSRWVTEDICYADDGGDARSVWTALRSEGDSLPEWGFGNAARWQCHLSLNLVLPSYTGGLWTRWYCKEETFLSLLGMFRLHGCALFYHPTFMKISFYTRDVNYAILKWCCKWFESFPILEKSWLAKRISARTWQRRLCWIQPMCVCVCWCWFFLMLGYVDVFERACVVWGSVICRFLTGQGLFGRQLVSVARLEGHGIVWLAASRSVVAGTEHRTNT